MNLSRAFKHIVNAKTRQNVFSGSKVFSRFSSITTWNKDWKPGPYPKTEEERIAAAKKYNMLPEDYEPYPEEEGFGDYPKFSATHMENLSDHNVYDFPVLKRNFGEPLHPDFDMCVEDKVNFQRKYPTPPWKMLLYVVTGMSLWSAMLILGNKYPLIENTLVPKQYPYRGQKSYTFEPAE